MARDPRRFVRVSSPLAVDRPEEYCADLNRFLRVRSVWLSGPPLFRVSRFECEFGVLIGFGLSDGGLESFRVVTAIPVDSRGGPLLPAALAALLRG